jgi:hypothetical protein
MTKITLPVRHDAEIILRLKNNYEPAEVAQELIRDLYYIAPIYPAPEKIKNVPIGLWVVVLAVMSVFLIGFTAMSFGTQSPGLILLLPLTIATIYGLVKLLTKQKNESLNKESKCYCGLTKDAIIFIHDQAITVKAMVSDVSVDNYQLQPPTFIPLESCTVIRTEDGALAIYTNKVEPISLYFAPEEQYMFKKYFLYLMATQNYEIFDADEKPEA